ncbi:hypothetical protein ACVWXM_001538 [Bradyrhizobium sp. GM7.3]
MAHCSHTRTLGQTVIGVSIFYCRADPQRRRSLDIASTNWAPAKGLARRTLRGTPFAAQRCALSPDTYRIAQLGSFSRARRASSHPSILPRPKLMSVTRARGKALPLRRLVASSPDAALSTPYPATPPRSPPASPAGDLHPRPEELSIFLRDLGSCSGASRISHRKRAPSTSKRATRSNVARGEVFTFSAIRAERRVLAGEMPVWAR